MSGLKKQIASIVEDDVLDRHAFGEAGGGYTECSCGWPTREQWESGEHPARHVIAELIEVGVLARVIPPGKDRDDG